MILRNLKFKKFPRLLVISGFAAFLLVALGLSLRGSHNISAQTPEGGVFVEGGIELPSGGDLQKDGNIGAGDTVIFHFRVTNRTDTTYPLATLQTGIDGNLLYDIWDLRGAASLSDDNETISFPNLTIAPQSRFTISVEGTLKYFTEGEARLTVSPQLLDRAGGPIGTVISTEHMEKQILPWIGELPWWIVAPAFSPSPSPTLVPTLEPTPEITPLPSITPEPTIEASPLPTIEPATSPTPTLEPTPTVTLEPSPVPSPSPL